MSTPKKIFVWTHRDLDGLVSFLVIKWSFPNTELFYQPTSPMKFREVYQQWLLTHNPSDFDRIFILDLDISEHKDLIDQKNVVIIDHHLTHALDQNYKKAKFVIETTMSACLLTYRTMHKNLNIQFTDAQKKLVLLGNDYDLFKHELPQSQQLNDLFWITKNNFEVFCNIYKNGFVDFTPEQLKVIKIHEENVNKAIDQTQFFIGKDIKISGAKCEIVAAIADKYIDSIADHILNIYRPDIAIIINPASEHVSFRRGENIKIDMGKVAALLTEGGGHPYASGGKLTPKFMEFTKLLIPL